MRQQLESAVLPQFVGVPKQVQQLSPEIMSEVGNCGIAPKSRAKFDRDRARFDFDSKRDC
jgi:hypothetical protein